MLAINSILQNRYQILRQIGEGGMGAVYLANDMRLGSSVALKETFFNNEMLLKAFEREARLLAGLRHPALPKVTDHFTEGDGQFLVMEFIPGDDLSEMLNRTGASFPPERVLAWADQLLDALEYLHSQRPPIIHRDIKPQNLKLTERGQIILLDFGLAKGSLSQTTRMTGGKSVFGYTPDYAPLEQIQGEGTDHRSDLYSLAATLYHLMTGVTPRGALMRVAAITGGQPDPLRAPDELNPQIKPAVASVLMWAMAVKRDQRPASATAMREALRDAYRSSTTKSSHYRTTLVVPPTALAGPVTQSSQPQPSHPSWPTPSHPQPSHPQPPYPPPSSYPPQLVYYPRAARKSNALLWVIGGGGLLLVVGFVAVALFIYSSNSDNVNSNRLIANTNRANYNTNPSNTNKQLGDPSTPTGSDGVAVDQILDKYIEALGGRDAIKRVSSRILTGSFEMTELGLNGSIEVYAKTPNKLMFAISFPGLGSTQTGYNGSMGWSQDPQFGLRRLSGDELASIKRDADFYKVLNLKQIYPRMTLKGKEIVNGREAYVIEAMPTESHPEKMYFDAQSGLLVRNTIEREGVQGMMTTDTYLDEYRTVDGIRLPVTLRQSNTLIKARIKIKEIRHNVPIDDYKFEMPSSK